MSKVGKRYWDGLETLVDRMMAARVTWPKAPLDLEHFTMKELPPNTLTNADGTPYAAGQKSVCSSCMWRGPVQKLCPICGFPAKLEEFPMTVDVIRAIVREEVSKALHPDGLVSYRGFTMQQLDDVIDFARQHGYEVGKRAKTVNELRAEKGLPPLKFVGGICVDSVYDKDGNEIARAKSL